ncbi:hypothetical protein QAD02_001896 [Eretmocerus hayati]|uniref:Uncharacterized protein n=1 Tax=Eretmocerus hayati TaxID=131215 RepID=A0ACC2NHR6_9HYME|nr:hypothetical protein QAD02_001896 [Eretmocerus hayati]
MKLNQSTRIVGINVILVPYREHHVLRLESHHLDFLKKSWVEDDDKCTFIILDKVVFEKTSNEIDAMVGDTNLYLNDPQDRSCAEIEIMIAEEHSRGKRFGWEAVILMLRYGIEQINLKSFLAKISMNNETSIRMFNKLGFEEVSKSSIFKEITLEKKVNDEWLRWLKSETLESKWYEDNELV